MHSLWSEKSRSWTLDKYIFQCVIPMMTYWFQYPLYSLHVLFIFLFFPPAGSWQAPGTADISLSPWGDKLPHIDVINLMMQLEKTAIATGFLLFHCC